MNELDYSLVKLYFKVNTSSSNNGEDDVYDPYLIQKVYFHDLLWAFSMSYMGNHFPHNPDDIPKGVKPAQNYLVYSPTEGILLCVGYYFKNDILKSASSEDFTDRIKKIVDNIDSQFFDAWADNGFQ